MKVNDLRQYTDDELRAMIRENSGTLADLKFNNAINPVENPNRIRQIRKDIARMHTILRERQLQAQQPA